MVKFINIVAMLVALAPVWGTTMSGAPAIANIPRAQGWYIVMRRFLSTCLNNNRTNLAIYFFCFFKFPFVAAEEKVTAEPYDYIIAGG